MDKCSSILGLDIGTTNISAVVINLETNTIAEISSVPNNSKLSSDADFAEYDVEWIVDKCMKIIDSMKKSHPNIKSIGITGQMHGMLYVNKKGEAVSPLYNWQDGRGNRLFTPERTYCEEILRRTGYACSTGYAFSTIFYNKMNYLEPKDATGFCTIMDYVAMVLTKSQKPVVHPTNAASFGLYDLRKNQFDNQAVVKLGISEEFIPRVTTDTNIIGYYMDIPICVAIGDNQASFLGSVKQEQSTALVNYGTGSQISIVCDEYISVKDQLEIRPYLFGKYLICGSALCGGRSYAILEKFFSLYAESIGEQGSQYEMMNRLAYEGYGKHEPLNVSTTFCGTRKNPKLRGCINDIDDKNFTPTNLILGVLHGMVLELKKYFVDMNVNFVTSLVASGNAIKQNAILKKILENEFGLEVRLTSSNEEASIGAALYAGVINGIIDASQMTEIITYEGGNIVE